MTTRQSIVDFIVEQMAGAGAVTGRKMFGEYGLFLDGKMVAIVGDDRLFLKPTPGGRAAAGALAEEAPYPGAKPCLVIPEERWDDAAWMARIARATAAELPAPKPKRSGAAR